MARENPVVTHDSPRRVAGLTKKWWFGLVLALVIGAAAWFSPLLISLAKPSVQAVTQPTTAPPVEATLAENRLFYARLGIEVPMQVLSEANPMVYSDWNKFREALRGGVALSYDTKTFEESPLSFISGHSSDIYPHEFSSVFAPLNQAEPGDTISFRIEGKTYHFSVTEKMIITPKDVKKFESLQATDPAKQRIALVTCWPLLTSKNRLVVVAERSR